MLGDFSVGDAVDSDSRHRDISLRSLMMRFEEHMRCNAIALGNLEALGFERHQSLGTMWQRPHGSASARRDLGSVARYPHG
jgi:hypothetical protein